MGGTLHQLDDLSVDVRLTVLPRERAIRPEVLLAVLARVRIGGLPERAVLLHVLRRRDVRHHGTPADRTAQHTREKVHMGVRRSLGERVRVPREPLLGRLPRRTVDDSLVHAIVQVIFLLYHRLVLVALAGYRLHAATPERDISRIHGVAQHVLYRARSEELVLAVPARGLAVALDVQLASDAVGSLGRLRVQFEDKAYDLCLLLVYL